MQIVTLNCLFNIIYTTQKIYKRKYFTKKKYIKYRRNGKLKLFLNNLINNKQHK